MNRLPRVGLVAVAVGVFGAWSTSAFAQDTTVVTPTAPAAPASPPIVVQQQTPAPALAQPVVAGRPAETAVQEESVPNAGLIISGSIMFGGSYLSSVVVAAESSYDKDHHLYVPLAGPWVDLASRGSCESRNISCDTETTNRVLLVADGILQAAGALQLVGGFVFPSKRVVAETAGVHVVPTAGAGNAGLTAYGRF